MNNLLPVGSRILVVGVSGSGKTSAAERLARLLGFPHIELDSIHWLPSWQEMPREEMKKIIAEKIQSPTWVIDGNYNFLREITWMHADTLIWLNYPLPLILWRLTRRTWRRVVHQETLWNNNRENFRSAFIGRESLYQWALLSYRKLRRTYPQAFKDPQYVHLKVLHYRSPAQLEKLFQQIEASKQSK